MDALIDDVSVSSPDSPTYTNGGYGPDFEYVPRLDRYIWNPRTETIDPRVTIADRMRNYANELAYTDDREGSVSSEYIEMLRRRADKLTLPPVDTTTDTPPIPILDTTDLSLSPPAQTMTLVVCFAHGTPVCRLRLCVFKPFNFGLSPIVLM